MSAQITASSDEEQPLLHSSSSSRGERTQDEEHIDIPEAHEEDSEVVQKKTSVWKVFWYLVLAVVVIFLLAVFIKGFIDADDVEVRTPLSLYAPHSCPAFSSISRKR